MASDWTEERVAQLRELWTEGLSCSQIARCMGNISRNGVIGKAKRLGLPGRDPTKNRHRRTLPTPKGLWPMLEKPKSPPKPAEPIAEPEPLLIDGEHITTETIRDHQCHWPYGSGRDIHYCGQPVDNGPYCRHHTDRAYTPARPSDRSKAKAAEFGRSKLMSRTGLG